MRFFKKKNKKSEEVEVEVEKEYEKSTTIKVFEHEENPWRIVEAGVYRKTKGKVYEIEVFRIDTSEWCTLYYTSQIVLGVSSKEFSRIIRDLFNNDLFLIDDRPYFESVEAAQEVIDEFAPYYDNFHVPKAIAERLMCYEEGGYPPYFVKYQK